MNNLNDFVRTLIVFIIAAACFTALFLMSSCSTPKVVTVTEYRDRVTHDTVQAYKTDSVYIAHYVKEKGDTVHITDTVLAFRIDYRDRVQYEYVHDSIPYEVTVQVPTRMRNGYDRFTSWGFWLLLVLLLIRTAWWTFKTFYLRR